MNKIKVTVIYFFRYFFLYGFEWAIEYLGWEFNLPMWYKLCL